MILPPTCLAVAAYFCMKMKNTFLSKFWQYATVLALSILLSGCRAWQSPGALKWEQLFNGKDLSGWQVKVRTHELGENFGNTFRVDDGLIQVRYNKYDEFDRQFGHLFYKKPYSYYLLAAEYRFTGEQVEGGPGWAFRNSGIMIHGQDPATMSKDQEFPVSMEVQLLGGVGDGERTTANLCTPGTQFVQGGKVIKDHCVSSHSETFRGDQWVRVEVLALGDSLVVHYINGEEV